jgi:hypothetical protein
MNPFMVFDVSIAQFMVDSFCPCGRVGCWLFVFQVKWRLTSDDNFFALLAEWVPDGCFIIRF